MNTTHRPNCLMLGATLPIYILWKGQGEYKASVGDALEWNTFLSRGRQTNLVLLSLNGNKQVTHTNNQVELPF